MQAMCHAKAKLVLDLSLGVSLHLPHSSDQVKESHAATVEEPYSCPPLPSKTLAAGSSVCIVHVYKGSCSGQSWALSVFLNFFNNKK